MRQSIGKHIGMAILALVAATGTASAADVTVDLRWITADGTVVAEKTLDLAALDALPQQTFSTATPWTTGVQEFSGPPLGELAALGGQSVVKAEVTALNDYSAEVPAEDWQEHGAVLVSRQNGETMRVRDKGPFWVLYPIDSDPALDSQLYHARMVWQVREIDFVVE
jgi:hypothetical protein